jgi:hypothetical protein
MAIDVSASAIEYWPSVQASAMYAKACRCGFPTTLDVLDFHAWEWKPLGLIGTAA